MGNVPMHFPSDENGDVLRRMLAEWRRLGEVTGHRFHCCISLASRALRNSRIHFRQQGYKISVEQTKCVPELPWDVIVVNHMIPAHSAISQFEEALEFQALQSRWTK